MVITNINKNRINSTETVTFSIFWNLSAILCKNQANSKNIESCSEKTHETNNAVREF